MTTPFVTNIRQAKAPKPASERSLSYLRDLMLDKAAHLGETKAEANEKIEAWYIQEPNQAQVSEAITRLKGEGYTGRKYSFAEEAPAQPSAELEDGFYELPGIDVNDPAFRIVKVQHAVHGSGNQYAKELNVGTGKFEYVAGLISKVRAEGTNLSLERARELGQLYGICVRCGATLTDEDSIAAGIGPVCATKF